MFATDRVHLLRPNLQIPAKTLVCNLPSHHLSCKPFGQTTSLLSICSSTVCTFLLHGVTVICREIPTWGLKQISLQAIWFFHYQYFVLSCFSKNDSSETPSKIMTQFFLPPPNSSHLQSAVRVSVCFSL